VALSLQAAHVPAEAGSLVLHSESKRSAATS